VRSLKKWDLFDSSSRKYAIGIREIYGTVIRYEIESPQTLS